MLPTAALAAGILLAELLSSVWFPVLLISSGLIIALIFTFAGRNVAYSLKIKKYHPLWVLLLFAGLGALSQYVNRPSAIDCSAVCEKLANYNNFTSSKEASDNSHFIVAKIAEISSRNEHERLLVKLINHSSAASSKQHPINNSFAYIYTSPANLRVGDLIRIPCRLSKFDVPDSESTKGHINYLKHHNILYQQKVKASSIMLLKHTEGFTEKCSRYRENMEELIELSPINVPTSNFLITLLLGDKRFADKETREALATSGLSHILALSGMHISIICSILFALLFGFNIIGKYKLRYLLTPLLLWIYVFLTGAAPATVRAAIMTTVALWAVIFERRNSALNALLASVFVILLVTPQAIHDIGLQLSVVAVGSILLFVRPLNPIEQHKHPNTYRFIAVVLTTLTASFSTSLLSAYYFHQQPLMFLPQNLIILPLLPFYITIAIIYLSFHYFGITLPFGSQILEKGFDAMLSFTNFINRSGNFLLDFTPHGIVVIFFILFLIMSAYIVNNMRNKKGAILFSSSLIVFVGLSLFLNNTSSTAQYYIPRKSSGVYIVKNDDYHHASRLVAPHSNSIVRIGNSEVVVFDDVPPDASLDKILERIKIRDCNNSKDANNDKINQRYYLISSGCYADPEELASALEGECVILHNSLNIKKEKRILEALLQHNIKAYSLRETGDFNLPSTMSEM